MFRPLGPLWWPIGRSGRFYTPISSRHSFCFLSISVCLSSYPGSLFGFRPEFAEVSCGTFAALIGFDHPEFVFDHFGPFSTSGTGRFSTSGSFSTCGLRPFGIRVRPFWSVFDLRGLALFDLWFVSDLWSSTIRNSCSTILVRFPPLGPGLFRFRPAVFDHPEFVSDHFGPFSTSGTSPPS